MEAKLIAVRGDQVVIRRGVKTFTVPATSFSVEDQQYFTEWKKKQLKELVPDLEVNINTGKSDRSDRGDSFDDRIGSFQFSISILNDERDFDLKGAKGILHVLGENCEDRDLYCVMQTNKFKIDVAETETFEWKGDPRRFRFDNRSPALWGNEYYGYIFRIVNAAGKVIYEKVTPKKFEDGVEEILKLRSDTAFDDEYRDRGRASIYD